ARRPLLLLRLRLALQRFRQSLLKLANPRALALQRLTGDGQLGFDLGLPRLCPPTHRPLLASHRRFDRTEIDDRLGEGALVGKSDGRVLEDAWRAGSVRGDRAGRRSRRTPGWREECGLGAVGEPIAG